MISADRSMVCHVSLSCFYNKSIVYTNALLFAEYRRKLNTNITCNKISSKMKNDTNNLFAFFLNYAKICPDLRSGCELILLLKLSKGFELNYNII